MTTFALPDLGEGLHEAEIVAWHVGVGDHVVADQPLLAVETDKAVVEIPAPWSGRIARLHGEPGDIVVIGAPLVDFDIGGASDSGAIVGSLPMPEAPREAGPRPPGGGSGKATPAVRALARRRGVDLGAVAPTGPGGAVSAADVERAAATLGESVAAEPLRGARRAMAETMARAGGEVVPATLMDEADVGDWRGDGDVSTRLVRAVAAACRTEPALNAWFDAAAGAVRRHAHVDLGVAVDSADGLFVPVLRGAGTLDATAVRSGVAALVAAVLDRSVALEDLRGATITLSNFGPIGGRHAALIVVPPQVAIVGAGRIAPRVVAVEGHPAVRPTLPLSLSFDHRAVTGGEAARFLAALIRDLERGE